MNSQTAEAITLCGLAPAAMVRRAWDVDLPSAPDNRATQAWATAAGLVIEETSGARLGGPDHR